MGTVSFEQRVRDLVLDLPHIAAVVIPLLAARSALRVQLAKLHKMLLDEVRADPVCRRLMTAPASVPWWRSPTAPVLITRLGSADPSVSEHITGSRRGFTNPARQRGSGACRNAGTL